MKICERIGDVRVVLDAVRSDGRTVGFVPTMGALHEGHLSLVRRARAECDVVCVSIFVNPAQFAPSEDLDAYPRPREADLDACEREGVDVVFAPPDSEMYSAPPATSVHVSGLTEGMEGRDRPTHFDGVALVVTKLFNIVGPCRAYFGQKDAQQLSVVRRMVRDLNQPVEVVGCPIVREPDGLAMSSRNVYLSPDDRARAVCLSRALFRVRELIEESGHRDRGEVLAAAREELADADEVDYIEIVDPDTFEPADVVEGTVLVCVAARIGGTRLIDNVAVTSPAPRVEAGVGRRHER